MFESFDIAQLDTGWAKRFELLTAGTRLIFEVNTRSKRSVGVVQIYVYMRIDAVIILYEVSKKLCA